MTRKKRQPGALPTNGTELQMDLLRAAKDAGWLVQMTRRSQMCRTESTSGFPDLVLARPGTIVFIECKSKYERLSIEQEGWFEALIGEEYIAQTEAHVEQRDVVISWYVMRPADYDRAMQIIKGIL